MSTEDEDLDECIECGDLIPLAQAQKAEDALNDGDDCPVCGKDPNE